MHLLWKKHRLLLALASAGIGVLVLAFLAMILPQVRYYLERANYHAALEILRQASARGNQLEADEPGSNSDDIFSYPAEVDNLPAYHARLRERYRRAAFKFWERPPVDLPLPYPWDRDRDRRVLEAVTARIIHRPTASDDADREHQSPNPTVVVDDKTTIGAFEGWYAPDVLPGGVPVEVADDVLRRNKEGPVSLAEFKFRSRQIVIADLDRLSWGAFAKYPDGVAFCRVSLPGYSLDGKTALVAVSIAFDQHGSGEYFALKLSNGEWQVVWSYLSMRE